MKVLIAITLFALSLEIGCSKNKIVEPVYLDGQSLHTLVLKAANDYKPANDSLSGLFDLGMIENNLYSSIKIDSFYSGTKKYFTLVIEYPNPLFNRFAIYDTLSNCYLIDKSLNGKLTLEVLGIRDFSFIKMLEEYALHDSLLLKRLSFYSKISDSISLVYRSFAELKTNKLQINQTITLITPDSLKTQFTLPKKYKSKFTGDTFFFDTQNKKFVSRRTAFDSLVYKEISTFMFEIQKTNI
jgi:hypothetical protein